MERLTIRLPDGQACVDCNRCKSERTSESNEAREMWTIPALVWGLCKENE